MSRRGAAEGVSRPAQALSFSFARSGRRTGSGGAQAFVVRLDLRQHGVETID